MTYAEEDNGGWVSLTDILKDIHLHLPANFPQKGNTYFETLQSLKKYYQSNEKQILELCKTDPHKWFWSYPMDWHSIHTPIEQQVWEAIRCEGRIVLYPQYPVLSYFVDFGNPFLKIALEADGKEYHQDKEKDYQRDLELLNHGWKVFRISGSKINHTSEEPYEELNEDDFDITNRKRKEWLHGTLEGLIYAMRIYFFEDYYPYDYEDCISVLRNHTHLNVRI